MEAEAAKRAAAVFYQGACEPYQLSLFKYLAALILMLLPNSVTDTLNQTTKGLPIVGGITEPLLDTVGGVTDGLPIVSFACGFLEKSFLSPILTLWLF